jgi:hypothetical protein
MGLRESDIQTGAKPQPLAHDNWLCLAIGEGRHEGSSHAQQQTRPQPATATQLVASVVDNLATDDRIEHLGIQDLRFGHG